MTMNAVSPGREEIDDWFAKHSRFHVHFTPTGSSWVNQVERFFGLITDQLIRRGVHTSVQAPEADIRDWIANWNQNPRPFTWVKTADDILHSLTKYGTHFRCVTLGRCPDKVGALHSAAARFMLG